MKAEGSLGGEASSNSLLFSGALRGTWRKVGARKVSVE